MKRFILALAALWFAHAAGAAVNLNTATTNDLVALPGIGPAKAQAIVDFRTQHGPFRAVEDVRKVKGIGEKLFLQIRPELTVSGTAARPVAPATSKAETKPSSTDPKSAPRTAGGAIAREDKASR